MPGAASRIDVSPVVPPRVGRLRVASALPLAFALLSTLAGCSDQDPIDGGPPPDGKTLWTVRARGGGDFTDLQSGIDAASDGDTILVGPGRYATVAVTVIGGVPRVHALVIASPTAARGRALTILSEGGPDSTVIGDETGVDYEIVVANVPGGVLSGFEIRGGGGNSGILLYQSTFELRGNRIVGSTNGFGARSQRGTLRLTRNHILANRIGVQCEGTALTSAANLFDGNTNDGLALTAGSGATIQSDTVRASGLNGIVVSESGATADGILVVESKGSGAYLFNGLFTVRQSTFALNGRPSVGLPQDAIRVTGGQSRLTALRSILSFSGGCGVGVFDGAVSATCCNFAENLGGDGGVDCYLPSGSGNFTGNPAFCNLDARDYRLRADSPCAPENSTGCGLIGAYPVACR